MLAFRPAPGTSASKEELDLGRDQYPPEEYNRQSDLRGEVPSGRRELTLDFNLDP